MKHSSCTVQGPTALHSKRLRTETDEVLQTAGLTIQRMKVVQLKWSERGGMWLHDQTFQSQGVRRMSETWEMCGHRKKPSEGNGNGDVTLPGMSVWSRLRTAEPQSNSAFSAKVEGSIQLLSYYCCDDRSMMTSPVLTALSTLPAVIQELPAVGKTKASKGKVRLALNHVIVYTPVVEETTAEELCISQRTPQSCSELGTQLSWSEWSPSSLNIAAVWYIVPDQTT